jgi:endoglucanase Acf2
MKTGLLQRTEQPCQTNKYYVNRVLRSDQEQYVVSYAGTSRGIQDGGRDR